MPFPPQRPVIRFGIIPITLRFVQDKPVIIPERHSGESVITPSFALPVCDSFPLSSPPFSFNTGSPLFIHKHTYLMPQQLNAAEEPETDERPKIIPVCPLTHPPSKVWCSVLILDET